MQIHNLKRQHKNKKDRLVGRGGKHAKTSGRGGKGQTARAGNKRRPERAQQTEDALGFVRALMAAPVPCIAIENPVGCISTRIRTYDQQIHPWQFGEDASKATCLWLKGLPLLVPTSVLPGGREARRANQTPSGQNKLGPSPTRWAERSKTYQGIADAMAEQWGGGGLCLDI